MIAGLSFARPLVPLCLVGLLSLSAQSVRAEVIEHSKAPLTVHMPSGFVDSQTLSPHLFEETQNRSDLDGKLLKLYLPEADARKYAEGDLDAVTRQVVIYDWQKSERLILDSRDLDLAAQSLRGAWSGCKVMPKKRDAGLSKSALLDQMVNEAAMAGVCLLVEERQMEDAVMQTVLLNYDMTPKTESDGLPSLLSTALSTALVLVNDSILFVTASSVVTYGTEAEHLVWVEESAEAFADMLSSAGAD